MDNIQRQERSNRIFQVIKQFANMFPDEFEKCDIKPCGHCKGTGLGDRHSLSQCSYCGGMGYKGFKKIGNEFVCRSCNGHGCSMCSREGIVDWVTHARGSDLTNKRYIK